MSTQQTGLDPEALSAVLSGNIGILKKILKKGKDYNVRNHVGWGLIHHAANSGDFECVKLILKKAKSDYKSVTEVVEKILPVTSTVIKETPLSFAAMKGHCDIVKLLAELYIESGINYETIGFPLHAACNRGQNKCIEILVKKMPKFINMVDDTAAKRCPIHITVEKRNIEGTKILIQNGCDVNYKYNKNQTPLHLAISNNNYEMVKLLANKVSDINAPGLYNSTPLFLATIKGKVDIVRCLLDYGADASKTSSYWGEPCLPIGIAAQYGHFETVKMLTQYTPQDRKKYVVMRPATHGKNDCLRHLFDEGYPTFDSNMKIFGDNIWILVMKKCQSDVGVETVKILLDKETLFYPLVTLAKVDVSVNYDSYFLSDIFAFVRAEVLTELLDAGILELRFDCESFPNVRGVIEKHEKFHSNVCLKRDIPVILTCLKYFPFLTWSHKNPSILPTQDNFGDGDLVQNVPSLLNLTRWAIRCLIIKNKCMIHCKYIESLKLPEFLVKC